MPKNFLRLPQERILAEQLRIVLDGVVTSIVPVIAGVGLVLWLMRDDPNLQRYCMWGFALVAANLVTARFAQSRNRSPLFESRVYLSVRALMLLLAAEGALWGTLAWLAVDTALVSNSFLVLAIITGTTGMAASIQGAIPVVYASFLLPAAFLVAAKLWLLGDAAHPAMLLGLVMFTAMMLGQANRIASSVLKSVELRFENEELVEKLRLKTDIADSARREAELANIAKSKFLASASHDLRQPIHAQGLFLDVLSRTELNPSQRELLASADAANNASAEMLDTLLDFSRIEAGVVEPHTQAFSVQPLLNKIEREFVQQADEKGLEYRSRESALVLHSDPALINLILRNLVSNAIRYSERGGLLVTCRRRGSDAMLEVYDTGIGIEESQQSAVFREFHQLGNPERDRTKGLGLGLAIVDGLARTLGHSLYLHSKRGRGSVFRLTVPIATEDMALTPLVFEASAARPLNVRVLVVDDDEFVRHSMRHLLRDWGCECKAVETIESALTTARDWAPGVVISDYRLRNQCSGIEVIDALRAELGQDLPALLITGDTAPQRLREAVGSGLPLLHKPVSPSRLYRELMAVLPG
jgi:signal transduction histidine kinase